jgi:hypothetical protein
MALPQVSKECSRGIQKEATVMAEESLAGWPIESKALATALTRKYGAPAESTAHRLAWYGNGPWKRTVLYKEEVPHNFPMKHKAVLEQVIHYKVPVAKFGELAEYDGAITASRLLGELSARSESEDSNFLTLNLAHDIVTGERNVQQALAYHAQVIRGKMIGERGAYLEKLKFTPPKTSAATADPGEVAPLIRHMAE